jgi:flagellar hook-basal body complex protein FliE
VDPMLALRAAEARGDVGAAAAPRAAQKTEGAGSFEGLLADAVRGADRLQHEADDTVRKFAVGEVDDVHQVMLAMDRADLSFRMTLEVRNKLLEAYQEVMRLQV